MKFKISSVCVVLVGVTLSIPSPKAGATGKKSPEKLTPALAEKLKNLPYGLSNQKSLFVRFRHVESVQFFGSGRQSQFGFKREKSLLPEGLSLLLTTNNKELWANGSIQFKRPLDVSKYNSLVVWAQATRPEMRIWLGLRSASSGAKKVDDLPARTDVLPLRGFPVAEPVQLVIPLSRFFSKPKIDLTAISQITFEFGKETVGNTGKGTIQIMGFAFVDQAEVLKRAQVVLNRPTAKIVLAESPKSSGPDDPAVDPSAALASLAKPPAPVEPRPMSVLGRKVLAFLKMTDGEALNFFKQLGLDFTPRKNSGDDTTTRPIKSPRSFSRDWIQPYSRVWPALAVAQGMDVSDEGVSDMGYYITVLALLVAWIMIRRRNAWPLQVARLGKVMHEIHWPFIFAEPSDNRRVERDFWKGVQAQHIRFGWFSTTGMGIEKTSLSEYFGESFLRRQIKLAAKAHVRIFPSLSFTDTVFRKGAFLSNPQRSASALRTLTTETLMRFADISSGVRVENTALFLNAKLRRRATNGALEREFWTDVITAVKAKRPGFIFIADAVGDQFKMAREVGFDYFENDRLLQALANQVRAGEVGYLPKLLSEMPEDLLKHSIFNITSLIKPLPKKQTEQHQNFLTAILLTLLPGILQHDDSMPDDLGGFITRISRSSVLRKGNFVHLETNSPNVFAFARFQKKSMFIAVANFSTLMSEVVVRLHLLHEGLEKNKLYLFNNALHGTSALKNLLHQPDSAGPAMALWGQNLREIGLPMTIPGLSLSLFSVSLSRPITPSMLVFPAKEGAVPALTE